MKTNKTKFGVNFDRFKIIAEEQQDTEETRRLKVPRDENDQSTRSHKGHMATTTKLVLLYVYSLELLLLL